MTLTVRQRRIGLVSALALTIAVTAVFGENEPAPGEPSVATAAVRPSAPQAGEAPAGLITLDKLNRAPPATEGIDLFASKSWVPPPPPVVIAKPAAPPKPTAPPLPYSYVGQMEGKEGFLVFLARGNDLLSVKPGEQLGTDYRLETVSPEQITFVYIPLGERQTLVTGGK
jgi:hypothetical protein